MSDDTNKYIYLIENMLTEDSEYGFAESTLQSIQKFAKEAGFLTAAQKKAVENILNSRPGSESYNEYWGY